MEKSLKNIAGVSLIEITIGMLLVAIALFTIVSIFPKMGAQGRSISEAEQARVIGMEVLERLQGLPEVQCGISASAYIPTKYSDPGVTVGAVTYKVKPIGMVPCINPPTILFKTVELEVGWTKSGKPHKVFVTGVVK